jgi:ADP-ribose pyrophosphatase YjhB (NUDIX family)
MRPGEDFPGVGVGLVIVRDAKILLYRRVRQPEAGHWNIVGGKIDHLEASIDAARREAEEESGLSIRAVEFLGLSEQIFENEGQHWLSLIYRAVEFSGEARVTEPEKLPEFGWFAFDDLPSPLSRFAADAVAMLSDAQVR